MEEVLHVTNTHIRVMKKLNNSENARLGFNLIKPAAVERDIFKRAIFAACKPMLLVGASPSPSVLLSRC